MKFVGINDILEHASWSDARKLVHISHKNQAGTCRYGFQQRIHQGNIDHRHLINNYDICFQRILLISFKTGVAFHASVQFQHAVNGSCLKSSCLTHSFCCAPRRCCQKDVHAFQFKITDNCINRCCLTGTRSSRNDEQSVSHCLFDCLHLMFIQIHFRLLFNLSKPLFNFNIRHLKAGIQLFEHRCRICLHIKKAAGINLCRIINLAHNNFTIHRQIHIMLFYIFRFNLQQIAGTLCQFRHRKICMPFIRGLEQCILNSASDTKIGVHTDSHMGCDLIRRSKPYTIHIIRHPIRVFL